MIVRINDLTNTTVLINVDHVIMVYPDKKDNSVIFLSNGEKVITASSILSLDELFARDK